MKVLIAGSGGIGRRHAENLRRLCPEVELLALRAEASEATQALDMGLVAGLDDALALRPDAAVVALPPALMGDIIARLLAADIHVYGEKPLAMRPAELCEQASAAENRGVTTRAGYCLRAMPGVAAIRRLIAEGSIGTVRHAGLAVGQWLPDWRPGRDYRDIYSSKRALGGGVLSDLIHEIDLARFLFGEFEGISGACGTSGALEMDCEDHADVILSRSGPNGDFSVNVHMDCIDRAGGRRGRLIGDEGTLSYDTSTGTITVYEAESGEISTIEEPEQFSATNAIFDCMADFVDAIDQRRRSQQPISDGLKSLELISMFREVSAGHETGASTARERKSV